jgi:hypothetical protein
VPGQRAGSEKQLGKAVEKLQREPLASAALGGDVKISEGA